MFGRKANAEPERLEESAARPSDEVADLSEVVQGLTDDLNRLARSVADVQSRLDAINAKLEPAIGDSRAANHLAIDVAKKLELSLIDLNELRRDVDAIREPEE